MNTKSSKYIPLGYFLSEDTTEEISFKIDNALSYFGNPIKKVLWLYISLKTIKSIKKGYHYYVFEKKTEDYVIELIENIMNLTFQDLNSLSLAELILFRSFFPNETQLEKKIRKIISVKLKEGYEDEFFIENEICSILLPFYNDAPIFGIDIITDRVYLIGETDIDRFYPFHFELKNILELNKKDEISHPEKENINKKLVIDINVFKEILSNFFNYVLKGSTIYDIEIDVFVDAIVNGKKGKTEKIKSILSIFESTKERSFFLLLIFYLSGIETIIKAPTAFCKNFVNAWQIDGLGISNLNKHTGKKDKKLIDFINTRNYDNLEMILSKQTNFNEFDEIFKTFIIKMREAKNAYSIGFTLKKK